jgi:hypothetical protein
MVLNVGLDASFDKNGEVSSTKPYITNEEIYR